MKNQPWMIFKPVTADVFYFWNGSFPSVIYNKDNKSAEPWYWNGLATNPMLPEETKLLNQVASTPRKRKFTIKRKKLQYEVVQRGEF